MESSIRKGWSVRERVSSRCRYSLWTVSQRRTSLGSLYLTRGLEGGHRIPRLPFLVPLQSVLGFLPLLARPSQLPANGERITFHKVVHEMKDIRDTQALQALFGKLDERLGPVTTR